MLCLQVFVNKIALSEIRKTQPSGSIFYFRYLSHSFQISVSCVSDIYFFQIRRNNKFQPLFTWGCCSWKRFIEMRIMKIRCNAIRIVVYIVWLQWLNVVGSKLIKNNYGRLVVWGRRVCSFLKKLQANVLERRGRRVRNRKGVYISHADTF